MPEMKSCSRRTRRGTWPLEGVARCVGRKRSKLQAWLQGPAAHLRRVSRPDRAAAQPDPGQSGGASEARPGRIFLCLNSHLLSHQRPHVGRMLVFQFISSEPKNQRTTPANFLDKLWTDILGLCSEVIPPWQPLMGVFLGTGPPKLWFYLWFPFVTPKEGTVTMSKKSPGSHWQVASSTPGSKSTRRNGPLDARA